MLRALGWIVVAVLLAGAAYELALALGFEAGRVKGGADAHGEVWVHLVAWLATFVGAVLAVIRIARPCVFIAPFAPAAAAFFAAFFFTYDPLEGRRYSDREVIGWSWFGAVIALALTAAVLTRIRPRIGAGATALVLVLLMFTTFAVGDAH